jgi:hypothetical protein
MDFKVSAGLLCCIKKRPEGRLVDEESSAAEGGLMP